MTEVCMMEDKIAVIVVASYRSVSRNLVRFKALEIAYGNPRLESVSSDLWIE